MATDIDFSGEPTKADRARLKAQARAGDDAMAGAYEDGRKAGRAEARTSTRRKARPTSARSATRTARRGAATVRRQAQAGRSGSSLTGLVVLSLLLVALYVALRGARHVGGFLGGIRSAVEWVADPHTVIPYGGTPT